MKKLFISLFILGTILTACDKDGNPTLDTKPTIVLVNDKNIVPGSYYKLDYNLLGITNLKDFKVNAIVKGTDGKETSYKIEDTAFGENVIKIQLNSYWIVPQSLDSGNTVKFVSVLTTNTQDATNNNDAFIVNPTLGIIGNPATQTVNTGATVIVNLYHSASVNLKSFSVYNKTDNVMLYDTSYNAPATSDFRKKDYDFIYKTKGLTPGTKKTFVATLKAIKGPERTFAFDIITK